MLRSDVFETLLYGCVTRSPRAYDALHRVRHSFLTLLHWLAKEQSHCSPDFLSEHKQTLMKTGSENIEAVMRRRRILFVGFVVRLEDIRLSKCVMFDELMGASTVRGNV